MIKAKAPKGFSPIPDPEYVITKLDNGLLVGTFPMFWLHEVGVTLLVRAGSRFEPPGQSGAAHFLEHMIFKGTASIPDPIMFHAHVESMAADMNAATGKEMNAYWINFPPEHLEVGLQTFSEMFTSPAFSEMETERRVILDEMREDENDQEKMINASILGGRVLWRDHALSRPILGDAGSVTAMTLHDLRAFMTVAYRGGDMALAFCGPLTPDVCAKLAAETFGSFPIGRCDSSPPPPPMLPGPHWVGVDDHTSQFNLTLFFRTGGFQDPEHNEIAAVRRLLDDGFSSRLQATLRERHGLVYDVWASYSPYSDTGAFEVGVWVSPDNLHAVFQGLLQQLVKLRQIPVGAEEWHRLLTRWHASLTSSLDRPAELLERYVADRLFGACEPLSVSWEKIQAMSPQKVMEVAARLTRGENMVVVLVGPEAEKNISSLETLYKKQFKE